MPTNKLTPEIIAAAIDGFEAQKTRIDAQIAELRQMLNPDTAAKLATAAKPKRKRKLSAAGRKAIGDATRRRWASVRAAKAQATGVPVVKRAARKGATAKA